MSVNRTIDTQARRLARVMSKELGLRRGSLAQRAARARRDLPRTVRSDIAQVAEAAHLSGHPRIAKQIDQTQVTAAYDRAFSHMRSGALAQQRRERRRLWAGGLALNLVLAGIVLGGVVLWQSGLS